MKGLITSGGLPRVSTGITPSYDQGKISWWSLVSSLVSVEGTAYFAKDSSSFLHSSSGVHK